MDGTPKKFPISMLSSSEESSYSEWEDELMVADSYESDSDGDDEDDGSSKKRRKIVSPAKTNQHGKDVGSSSKKIVSPAKTNRDDKEKDKDVGRSSKKIVSPAKTNCDDKEKDVGSGSKKIVSPANPDDYPRLASFLRQNHMEEELQRNWTVIGDENATKLQQRWVRIIEKQMDIAAYKLGFIIVALKQLKGILEIVHVIRHDKAFAVISVY
ncbi:hypothetical protein SASPL_129869 [Salvia splendens]|uniref:Uncharacterized protein n=1 Tax=Salvia splendens TaxID=180675 RepID=A0A8X8XGM1_SALSN|nr:hypothetical protein SASPL_129869 [Salvia splendens]